MLSKIALGICLILALVTSATADKCRYEILLGGADSVVLFNLDTTDHWWAITKPFSGAYSLIIDGETSPKVYEDLRPPVFSPNGNGWAAFVRVATGWQLLTADSVIPIECTDVGDIEIGQSGEMSYSYLEGNTEVIVFRGKSYRVQQRLSRLHVSPDGTSMACVIGKIGGQYLLTSSGEGPQFDEIKLAGIWYDGTTCYAGRQGTQWKVYRGTEAVSGVCENVAELTMNPFGTVAAAVCNQPQSSQAFLYSDDYTEPLESKRYDVITNLVLHPNAALMGFRGVVNSVAHMVLNRTEYDGGKETSAPFFTHDGSEFVYCGFDTEFFISINGKKYVQNSAINLNQPCAVMPKGNTYAVATSTGMVVRELEKSYSYSGKMVDGVEPPIYSWRHGEYESLGMIGNKVILLKCKMDE
ncbi:MAG: hypothetical protein U0264_04680 [Candidatus Kapaibacterium sp.]